MIVVAERQNPHIIVLLIMWMFVKFLLECFKSQSAVRFFLYV